MTLGGGTSSEVFCLFSRCCWSEELLFRPGLDVLVGMTGLGMFLLNISSVVGSTIWRGMFKPGIAGSSTKSAPSGVNHSSVVHPNFRSFTLDCLFFQAPSTFEAALFFFLVAPEVGSSPFVFLLGSPSLFFSFLLSTPLYEGV